MTRSMAETTANEAAQRYAVIEQAYSKENWAAVLQEGEGLLLQLRQSNNPQLVGLQMRLQLLLGHTQLYGCTDKGAAAGYYRAVAAQSSEAAITRIAAQGLNQCAIEDPRAEPAPAEAPTSGGPGPAAPWLTAAATAASATASSTSQTPSPPASVEDVETSPAVAAAPWSEPSLIPEVVEEPELIELHQADPSLAEDVELDWKEPAPAATAADIADEDLLRGLMLVQIG